MNDAILDGIQETMRSTFGDPAIAIDVETTAEDVDGWDSLAHAQLIVALEDRFHVFFPAERLFTLNNVGELRKLIESCGGSL